MNRISVNQNLEDPKINGCVFCVIKNDTKETDPRKSTISGKQIYLEGGCKIIYNVDNRFANYKIAWVETDDDIIIHRQDIEYNSMNKKIHINTNTITNNNKFNLNNPICEIEDKDKIRYCMELIIKGPSRMLYDPTLTKNKIWIETNSDIEMIGEQIDYIP